ncbi:Uncharacterised protein [Escherichia coli]|uniref:Uncharacterized protein n=1 Tax=Escherichia coli TaxID=562 RepID=A0A3S4JTL2_ECOLX|nr:Uncharacterised protein [Escherichia coli]
MSDYSYLSILKTCAKKLARIQKIKLSKALEIVPVTRNSPATMSCPKSQNVPR